GDRQVPLLGSAGDRAPARRPIPGGPMKPWLLLVEDDDEAREALAGFLRRRGHVVETAEHGAAALERLQRSDRPPALILLDLMMPVMNGWELRATLLADPTL